MAEAESQLAAERAVALERVAGMTAADAKAELVATIESAGQARGRPHGP